MEANPALPWLCPAQRAKVGKAGVLKLLCCASELPFSVRKGLLPDGAERVASGFDLQKMAAYLPSTSRITLYVAPDVAPPDVGGHVLSPQSSLRDRQYGLWAGQALRELAPVEQRSVLSDTAFTPPQGESFATCYQRTTRWLERLEDGAPTAVVLARPAIVRNLVLRVLYCDEPVGMDHAARVDVAPCSYSLLTRHAGRWRVAMLAASA